MVAFKSLWDSFPNGDTIKATCFNKQAKSSSPFDNYCAILLSECFIAAGISLGVCRAFPATAIERWLGQLRQCQRTPIA